MKLPKISTTGFVAAVSESLTTPRRSWVVRVKSGAIAPEVRAFEHRADVAVEDHLEPVDAVGERGEPGPRPLRDREHRVAEVVVGEVVLTLGDDGEERLPLPGGDPAVAVGIDHVEPAAPLPRHPVPCRPLRPVEVGRGDHAVVVAVQPLPGGDRSRELGAVDRAVGIGVEPRGQPLPRVPEMLG